MNVSEIWKDNAEFVLKVCRRFVKDETLAEDIRQDVFLKILNSKKDFEKGSSIKTWLYSIAYHCCMDYFRKQKKQREITDKYIQVTDFPAKDSEAPSWGLKEPTEMPCPVSHLIMELYFWEEWSKRDISKVFCFTIPQINKRIQVGLDNMQNFLD